MASSPPPPPPSAAPTRRPKRLLFDRRYGWVVDEWKDPSEEALAGGRGIADRFCVLPLAQALVKVASQSIIFPACNIARALKEPEQWSPLTLKANLSDQFQKLVCSIQRHNLNPLNVQGINAFGRQVIPDSSPRAESSTYNA
ncbi:hypothetical protein QJS04_geneDACA009926 [Acorus gramineus]|uniref:Uncharacterized protein n=1 Tax=Acorus gramineus TaxID=55184 RepID=A0AAV9BFC4_ACOGR|nr:hypothetical protein QJS04_geneDACA009926 [Acorus gramineus]